MRWLCSLLLLLCLLTTSQCAVIEKDQRRLTNLAWACVPEGNAKTAMTTPIWLPVCTVTLVADAFVLNPVFNAPAALDDAMWAFFGFGIIMPAEVVLLPVRTVAFVPLFLGSELLRCTIPYYPDLIP